MSIVDAVMASCAIPLIWPTVYLDGQPYLDGGIRSPVNLDLAHGTAPVIALAPTTRWHRWGRLSDQRAALRSRPHVVLTISREGRRAQGRNPLSLNTAPAYFVSTDSQWRGRGVATAMTAAALGWAYQTGAQRASLDASPAGLSIYARLGFEPISPTTLFASFG